MSKKPSPKRPLFLVKTGSIDRKDIQRVERLCGICVLEIASLGDGQFETPPPIGDLSMQAHSAMQAMLAVASHGYANISVSDLLKLYTKLTIEGKPKTEKQP